ncbi:MAG: CotH kinase family protein [Clostridia bacterium]|nr:CotH kinase family protein [Clostridia bacterium]
MNRILRTVIFFSVLGILSAFLAVTARAEKAEVFRAGCPSVYSGTVETRKGRAGYILSLPGSWNAEKITLELDGAECLYLGTDRTEIRPGQEIDVREYLGAKTPVYNAKGRELGNLVIHRGSAVPALFLEVDAAELGRANGKKEYEIRAGRAVYCEADGTVSYDGSITQMKGRGNNTFRYVKKPYQIKLSEKASLSGMNKAKTWVLLANWNDASLLRNQIALDMSRAAGLSNALSCVPADVWINGQYNGLYLVTEKIQIKKGRLELRDLEEETEKVNSQPVSSFVMYKESSRTVPLSRGYRIPENPEDITGGYIMTIEKFARLRDYKVAGFRTRKALPVQIKEPTFPSREQVEYLAGRVNEMHDAVIADDGVNPATGRHYTDYLDMDSFAVKFLVEDWTKDYDFIGGSQFMYKDSDTRDPLIYAGPAWDYDLAFGNMADRGTGAKGNYITAMSHKTGNIWWLLSRHTDFMNRVRRIWTEEFRPAAAVLLGEKEAGEGSPVKSLESYVEAIRDSAKMNFARWNVPTETYKAAAQSFENAVFYLEKWIRERTAYMDGEYAMTEKHE